MSRTVSRGQFFIIVTILSAIIIGGQLAWVHSMSPVSAGLTSNHHQPSIYNAKPSNSTARVYLNPSNVTNVARTSGQITFGVYLNDSPPLNLFSVSIQYNHVILHAASVNSTGDALNSTGAASILYYCIDGVNQVSSSASCLPGIDGPGVVTYSLVLLGGESGFITNGLLFHVTFNIVGSGLAQLHMLSVGLFNSGSAVSTTSTDGFFANGNCGSTVCRPPSVNVTLTPATFSVGRLGTFNATVVLNNPDDTVLSYTWDFGLTTATSTGTQVTTVPYVQHAYQNAGTFLATVEIEDTYNVFWTASIIVNVTTLYISLVASQPKVNPQQMVIPGTPVFISASISNNSTVPENATFSITVDGTLFLKNSTRLTLAAAGGEATLNTVWNTTGFTPEAYAITVIIPVVPSENKTAGNIASSYVLLVSAPSSGLTILETTGLGVLVLVGVVVVLSRFMRKPSYEQEPL
jgi:hypothetical protein